MLFVRRRDYRKLCRIGNKHRHKLQQIACQDFFSGSHFGSRKADRNLKAGCAHAMSAAVIGQLLSTCAGACSAASSAVWWAASLPPTCRETLAHAALTCSGATPRYFTPGFGPLALASGWLLLGVLLGLLFRRAAAAMVALAGGCPADCAPCSWEVSNTCAGCVSGS